MTFKIFICRFVDVITSIFLKQATCLKIYLEIETSYLTKSILLSSKDLFSWKASEMKLKIIYTDNAFLFVLSFLFRFWANNVALKH